MQKLLKAQDVAQVLDVTESRVYDLVRQGLLPAVRLGRQIRFDPATLESWVVQGGKQLSGGWKRLNDQGYHRAL